MKLLVGKRVDINGRVGLETWEAQGDQDLSPEQLQLAQRIANEINEHACTPLIAAVKEGHEKIVEYLLQEGADIDLQDSDGRTAVHYAVENQNKVIVESLLGIVKPWLKILRRVSLHGVADCTIRDLEDMTPLALAAQSGNKPILKLLFEEGRYPSDKVAIAKGAFDEAIKSCHMACFEYLLEKVPHIYARPTVRGRAPYDLLIKLITHSISDEVHGNDHKIEKWKKMREKIVQKAIKDRDASNRPI